MRYEVTDHCNATCIMCPRDKHEHGREHGIMDQANYEKSIDEVVQLGAKKIVLTGFGEPMLDKRLEQKIAYAKSKGLGTYFITNGSALTPVRSQKLLAAGLDEMRVSFYGMRPETYNAVMQGLDFNRTHEGRARIPAPARRDEEEDARADVVPRAARRTRPIPTRSASSGSRASTPSRSGSRTTSATAATTARAWTTRRRPRAAAPRTGRCRSSGTAK